MTKNIIHFITIIVLFIAACSGKDNNCREADGLKICTISFTPEEIDTIILRKFSKGTGFKNKIDTLIMDSTNAFFEISKFSKDSSVLAIFTPAMLIKSKYDFEIYFPAVNKLVKITEIDEPLQKQKKGIADTTYCTNVIKSFKMDGQTVNADSHSLLFIHR